MCGICGIYGSEDNILIKKMCTTLIHRGPDDSGFFSDTKISLGHRRLSIIDLESGHQPIHNEDETIWVIFNGEIYNFQQLKEGLLKKHSFYTKSDTEVIVHLYEDVGEAVFSLLNGMFAIAIWDSTKKKLILGRDPIGKKPLYYYNDGKKFLFASEIKAILEAKIPRIVNEKALGSFLAYQYTLGNETLFQGIKKLMGGHYLTIDKTGIKIRKYWEICENLQDLPEEVVISKLRKLLEQSASRRIIADVPIGSFLSGGIDSSVVTALTKRLIDYEFHTFSIGFESFSELPYAKLVSEHLDTNHHEIIVTPDMVIKNLQKIAWHYDEPLGDAAIINNFFLSKEANKFVKVVMAGEGGDELFAGYSSYEINLKYYNLLKRPGLNNIIHRITTVFPYKGEIFNPIWNIEKKIKFFSHPGFMFHHQHMMRQMDDDEISWISNIEPQNIEMKAFFPENIVDPLNQMLAIDCKNLLPEDYLMKADKATMANSVEERLPLLDKDLIEFSFSIPQKIKMKNNNPKYLLKMAVKDLLPPTIITRKKQGFGTPILNWLCDKNFNDMVISQIAENELIDSFFQREKIEKIVNESIHKRPDRYPVFWSLFALALWHDTFFEN